MKRVPFFLSLSVGFIIILINIYGFFLLRHRPAFPPINEIFPKSSPEMNIKNILRDDNLKIQIDTIEIKSGMDIEFIMSQKAIGEWVTITLTVDDKIEKKEIQLIPYYSQVPYPLIYLVIGLFCFALGIVVFILRAENLKARIYYWASLAFASSIIISGGYFCMRKDWLSLLPGILFYILYPLAPALLFHFSFLFSKNKIKIIRAIIYCPALFFVAILEALFLYSSLNSSLETHRIYQSVYYVFRSYLVLFVLLTFLNLIMIYRKTAMEEVRAQIKWIFYGLFVGLGPFILLYQLPQVIRDRPLIPDEFSSLFFIFVPLAFAFSIVKLKLMDIELVINRSLVYFILTVFTVSVYLFSVALLQNIFSIFFSTYKTVVSVFGALTAAGAFHPARRKIQMAVDKAFFRMSYDYKKSILSFSEKAYKIVDRDQLIEFFFLNITDTLPMEHIGVFIQSVSSRKPMLLIKKNGDRDLSFLTSFSIDSDKIFARKIAVRTEENIDYSQEKALLDNKIELVISLSFKSSDLAGFLSLGKKKSGERFVRDDIELLLTMTRELALNLERLNLQEEVIHERLERDKLDELNSLKTEFISSVSHELRTPLTTIQGLAEILKEGKIKNKEKQNELINLVASESSHLSQFLHNILDFGKIEQQVKTYNFQKIEIQSVIKEAIKLFMHRLESEEFELTLKLAEKPLFLDIDRDAVRQALINLIDNAIKYSSDKKEITILLIEKEKHAEIQVKDKGIGIPSGETKKIFEKFYRHTEASHLNPKGVGLGLKIIKHIIEAHRGEIKVESQLKKGSTFSLIFPKP